MSIHDAPQPPVSSMNTASARQSAIVRATAPAPWMPSRLRYFSGAKAANPWRGKITEASSPKRATSTPNTLAALA